MPREQAVLSPLPVGVWLAWTSATAPVARRPGARTPTFGFSGGLRWPKGRSRRQVEPRNHPQLRAFDLTSEEPHPVTATRLLARNSVAAALIFCIAAPFFRTDR